MKKTLLITTLLISSIFQIHAVTPAPGGDYPNYNTALGQDSMFNLDTTSAQYNTAIGSDVMYWAVDCESNTGVGAFALINNTTGGFNTAIGDDSLFHNTTGSDNTGLGIGSLYNVTTGNNNIGIGDFGGSQITTENYNVDIANVGVIGDQGVIRIGQSGNQTKTFIIGIYNNVIANQTRMVVIRQNGQMGIAPVTLDSLIARIEQLERQLAELTSK